MEELEKNKTIDEFQQMSKKERKILKRQQKEKERLKYQRQKKLKKILRRVVISLVVGGVLGLVWFISTRPPLPESEIISKQGIHWHADLTIKISGQYHDISSQIGIGAGGRHRPVHTHEADGVVHMEFLGLVRKKDITLGRFFENWGKEFSQNCILDKCNGLDGEVNLFVNKEQNFEFENYIMKDNDRIEIIFE